MTTPLCIAVPEAASSVDTIQFKIVLGEEVMKYCVLHSVQPGCPPFQIVGERARSLVDSPGMHKTVNLISYES
jgi:hypothetical protein